MKDVKGFEGLYTINEDGQLFNAKGKKVKVTKGKATLMDGDKRKRCVTVARLVLLTFVGESDNQVEYLDGNRENIALSNLKWKDEPGTHSKDSLTSTGKTSQGEKDFMAFIHYVYASGLGGGVRGFSIEVTYRYYAVFMILFGKGYKTLNTYRSAVEEQDELYTLEAIEHSQKILRDGEGIVLHDGSRIGTTDTLPYHRTITQMVTTFKENPELVTLDRFMY